MSLGLLCEGSLRQRVGQLEQLVSTCEWAAGNVDFGMLVAESRDGGLENALGLWRCVARHAAQQPHCLQIEQIVIEDVTDRRRGFGRRAFFLTRLATGRRGVDKNNGIGRCL